MTTLTPEVLTIVRFCAQECQHQMSGELSVGWMVNAWAWAQDRVPEGDRSPKVTEEFILNVAMRVEPTVNARGFRTTEVTAGGNATAPWPLVPIMVAEMIAESDALTPEELYRRFEELHPFRDGNGRTGQVIYNFLKGTLDDPIFAPDYWGSTT